MAVTKRKSGAWELRVTHKLLPKPFYATFDTEAEARQYQDQLRLLLNSGVVPEGLLEPKAVSDPHVARLISEYSQVVALSASDDALLRVIGGELLGVRESNITADWVDAYIHRLKVERNLAPGTIRKRIGSLARLFDWRLRRKGGGVNPFRNLPAGYSNYSGTVAREVTPKFDVQRDRRLLHDEEQRILAVLDGDYEPANKQRKLDPQPALKVYFLILVNTGLRAKELYTLRCQDIDLAARIMRVRKSKMHRGKVQHKDVPIVSEIHEPLVKWLSGRKGEEFVFDFIQSEAVSSLLTNRLRRVFEHACVSDLRQHDLRHEATCRWLLMKNEQGGWMFSEVMVAKIIGHSSLNMMMRYASLRSSDLVAQLR